jgi:regulator of RNase E activity RraA
MKSKMEKNKMALTAQDFAALAALDTPTVCNALEITSPERRGHGFTRVPLVSPIPQKAIVGYARTATIRSREKHTASNAEMRALRLAYYEYIAKGPHPSVVVIQDVDGVEAGLGAFWGEVQSNVHKGLGCGGVITNGSVRDLDQWAKGFFVLAGSVMPSHVWADLVAFDVPVSIAGMRVNPGDLVHADKHGAVVVPDAAARDVPKAAALVATREAILIGAAQKPSFSIETLRKAFAEADEIH